MNTSIILSFLLSLSLYAADKSIYDFKVKSSKGEIIDFKTLKNKPLLFVNIATKCGFTPQLDDLQTLYKKYSDSGLNVIGIPANDFGGQTPENDKNVEKFCRLNYGVKFPLTTKLIVTGKKKSDLVKFLISKSDNKEIQWNFEKFLFNNKGKFIKRFNSSSNPLNGELEKHIKQIIK